MERQMSPDDEEVLTGDDYSFLVSNEHLGDNIGLLYLGGSRAYGLDTPTSDYDVRGYALLRPVDYYTMKDFGQIENKNTDTTVYSVNKFIKLLTGANPNILEVFDAPLSVRNKEVWDLIKSNFMSFLSTRRVLNSFRGYAVQQKKRMDKIISAEDKVAIGKIGKYQCNCIRSLRMGAELLSSGLVRTYRSEDRDQLMDLKNTAYSADRFETLYQLEYNKLMKANENTVLPEKQNIKIIDDVKIEIGKLVLGR